MTDDSPPRSAKWLWYDLHEFNIVNAWMQARKSIVLDRVPEKAVLNVTADTSYRLFVNGKHVNRGPARGFQRSWPYDSVDIAPFLKKGNNVIAALVHSLGVGTFSYHPEGNAGFLLWGNAGGTDLTTDRSWKVRAAPGFLSTMTRVSLELNFQEIFDGRLDDGSWLEEGYDDTAWKTPMVRSAGCMPWPRFEKRGIPLLKEEVVLPQKILSTSKGPCTTDYRSHANVVRTYLQDERKWAKGRPRLELREGWAAVQFAPTGKDGYGASCIDFGKEVVGSLEMDIDGAEGMELVDTLVCEAADKATPIFQPITEGSRPAFGNRLNLGQGRTRHEQFDHWGFRYLVLVVRNSNVPLAIRMRLHAVEYPLDVKATFRSSDNRLNRIYDMCVWSQRCCMLDAYIDCPWREQAQWWGDARVQGRNTFFLSADTRLFRRGIVQLGTQESDNGLTYGVTPTTSHRCILPDFSLVWILTHWDYYWQTGDLSLFKAYEERLRRLLEYFRQSTAKNGLIPYDDRYWLFLDWHPIFKEGYPAVYNLLYLWALRTASRLFKLAGKPADSRLYQRRASALERAIKTRLFKKKDHLFHGGLDWKGKPAGTSSVHSLALAVLMDLHPEHHREWVEKHLVPMVQGEYTAPIVPSPYFMYYIFEALKKTGRLPETVDCIRRWWGSMLDRGYTTTEEIWNGKPGKDSLCHAWSAHPIIHLSNILLGVWQEAPGWKRIRFAPLLNSERSVAGKRNNPIRSVEGKVAVPQGVIEVRWERRGRKTSVSLSLPKGIIATVDLPNVPKKDVRGKCSWTIDSHLTH